MRVSVLFGLVLSSMACSNVLGLGEYSVRATCSHNADCGSADKPGICRASDHSCVTLLSNDCTKVVGNYLDDNAIVIGTLFSLKGTNASSGLARTNSVELALSEISQTIVGVPGGADGKPRPLVAVECDDSTDNTVATRSANHLAAIGVAAIIGPGGSGQVSAVAQSVTIPDGIFLISPSATSTSLTGLSPLVWRTAPSDLVQSIALRDQASELESLFLTQNMAVRTTLGMVYQGNPYGQGLLDAVSNGLELNGASVTDPQNQMYYEPRSYDPTMLDPTSVAGQFLSESLPPNIFALFGTAEVITKFMAPVENGWPKSSPRPFYLLSDGGKKQELLDLTEGNDGLRVRVRGTVPGTSGVLFQTFNLHYQGKFGDPAPVFGMAGAYDSTYIVAYALAVMGSNPPNGAGFANAMSKLVGGTKTDIGPDALATAMQALSAGGSLDINGASGPLDFDLATHEAASDIDVWCVTLANGVTSFASSGRHYDSVNKQMTGTFSCP